MNLSKVLGAAVLCVGVNACSSSSPMSPSSSGAVQSSLDGASTAAQPDHAAAAKPGRMTIVGIVLQDDGEFDVLQAAVVRAGLVDALDGPSQVTVFAPTDAAFVSTLAVPDEASAIGAVNGLPIDTLTNILLYHVTEGRRTSRSVLAAPRYEMLNGEMLDRSTLSAAGLEATDISASNGIIHVIGSVLIP